MIINSYRYAGGAPPAGLLLDTYAGAAVAYSLRKLRTAYTGAAIRVRESSGNTEADIGFDGSGNLDTVALLAHCGANDGFITTWYDQSAGTTINAAETTASRQPRIVSGGVVILDNGKPAMEAVDITTTLTTTLFSLSTTNAFFNVNSKSGSPFGSYHNILAFGTLQTYSQGTNYQLFQGTAYNTGLTFDAQAVISEISVSGTLEFFKNGVSGGTRSAIFGLQTLQIMRYSVANQGLNGKMQELIVYDLDQTSNRAGIENNIINYYGIT